MIILRYVEIPYNYFRVADDDGGEGNDKLGHVCEGAVHQLGDPVPGLLTVDVAELIGNQLHEECVTGTNILI